MLYAVVFHPLDADCFCMKTPLFSFKKNILFEPAHDKNYKKTCVTSKQTDQPGPKVYKTFFMLNSAEHEICSANKSQITKNCNFFLDKNIAERKSLC